MVHSPFSVSSLFLLVWNKIVPGGPEAILVLWKEVNLLTIEEQKRQKSSAWRKLLN